MRSPGRTAEGPGWSLQACANSRRPAGKIGIRQSATDGEHRTAGAPGGRSYALGDSREPRYHLVGVHMVDVAGLRLIECLDSALARERPWLPPGGKADSQRLTDEKRRNLAKRNAETIVRQIHIAVPSGIVESFAIGSASGPFAAVKAKGKKIPEAIAPGKGAFRCSADGAPGR